MSLIIFDITMLQFLFLPFYFLSVITFFGVHIFKRKVLLNWKILISNDHVSVYSYSLVFNIFLPFFFIFLLLINSVRSAEVYFCLSQLYVTPYHIKYFNFIFNLFFLALFFFKFGLLKTTLNFINEIFFLSCWLLWIFFWITLVNNLLIYVFFLEILSILLIVLLLYSYLVVNYTGRASTGGLKLFNLQYTTKFLFFQAVLFFLWSSAVSMLLLFWSSVYLLHICFTLDFSVLNLLFLFETFYSNYNQTLIYYNFYFIYFIFFISILLKTAIVPMHIWLITFYKNLPILSIFFYLTLYYIYFIIIIFNLLFNYLFVFSAIWQFSFLTLLILNFFIFIFNVNEAYTFRSFIAISSILNLLLLFLFYLV